MRDRLPLFVLLASALTFLASLFLPWIQLRAPHSEFASGNGSDQGILTLPSLELIRFRDGRVIWGAVILVGLCVLLAVLGWVEENRGLESLQVPEIWRIDRLPGES
jgi:hypothetical protein